MKTKGILRPVLIPFLFLWLVLWIVVGFIAVPATMFMHLLGEGPFDELKEIIPSYWDFFIKGGIWKDGL